MGEIRKAVCESCIQSRLWDTNVFGDWHLGMLLTVDLFLQRQNIDRKQDPRSSVHGSCQVHSAYQVEKKKHLWQITGNYIMSMLRHKK